MESSKADFANQNKNNVNEDGYYEFDNMTVCLKTRELKVDKRTVPLENKPFEFLVYLIRNRNKVVSKEELHAALWHERPISETVMATCLRKVRKAINDDSKSKHLIKTYPSYGYRFIGKVKYSKDTGLLPPVFSGLYKIGWKFLFHPLSSSKFVKPAVLMIGVFSALVFIVSIWSSEPEIRKQAPEFTITRVTNDTGNDEYGWVELGLMKVIKESFPEAGVNVVLREEPGLSVKTVNGTEILFSKTLHDYFQNNFRNGDGTEKYLLHARLQQHNDLLEMSYRVYVGHEVNIEGSLLGQDAILLANYLGESILTQINMNKLRKESSSGLSSVNISMGSMGYPNSNPDRNPDALRWNQDY